MSNAKKSKYNPKSNYELKEFFKTISGDNDLAALYLYGIEENLRKIRESFDDSCHVGDKKLNKDVVERLKIVLISNLNTIYSKIDIVNKYSSANKEISTILEELGDNDLCRKRKAKSLEKVKADLGLGLMFADKIEEVGCFFEKIKTILESLRVAIENADTDEEKLKEFLGNYVFREILINGLISLKMTDPAIDEIYRKSIIDLELN